MGVWIVTTGKPSISLLRAEVIWKCGFHVFWFSLVFPFIVLFLFLTIENMKTHGHDPFKALGGALVGSIIGIYFFLLSGLLASILTIPFLLFTRWQVAFPAMVLAAALLVWSLAPEKTVLNSLDWGILSGIVAGLLAATFAFYRGLRVFGLARH